MPNLQREACKISKMRNKNRNEIDFPGFPHKDLLLHWTSNTYSNLHFYSTSSSHPIPNEHL